MQNYPQLWNECIWVLNSFYISSGQSESFLEYRNCHCFLLVAFFWTFLLHRGCYVWNEALKNCQFLPENPEPKDNLILSSILLYRKCAQNYFLQHNQICWVWSISCAEKINWKTSEIQGIQYKRSIGKSIMVHPNE